MSVNQPMTLRVGDEYDFSVLSRLRTAVASMGGTMTESFWGAGGSQEITRYEISLPDGVVEVEAETYVSFSFAARHGLFNSWRLQHNATPNPSFKRIGLRPAA